MNYGGFRRRALGAAGASLVIALASAHAALAAAGEIRIVHHPPVTANEGTELLLDATLTGDGARSGVVRYRHPGGEWTTVPLAPAGDHWSAVIPSAAVRAPAVEYYLRMESLAGDERTDPAIDPEAHPYLVTVAASPATRMTVVSPEPGEVISPVVAQILVVFDPPLPSADGVLVLLDRSDITALSEVTPEYLLYAPVDSLDPGPHVLRVFYIDESGATADARWSFEVSTGGAALEPFAGGPGGEAAETPAQHLAIRGRWEGGWALVHAHADSADAALPYPERRGVLVNAAAYGHMGARDLALTVNRNPLYDAGTRISLRLDGPRDMFEAGDVFPYLSDEALAWVAARGAWGEVRRGASTSRLVFLRTVEADVADGAANYSQYLAGASQVLTAGRTRTAFTAVRTFDAKGSLPPAPPGEVSPFVGPAITNTVWVVEEELQAAPRRFRASLSWSRQASDDLRRRAFAYRLGVAGNEPHVDYALEFRSRRPGYLALGAPALNSGEEGFFLDTRIRSLHAWDAALHLETYRDYESSQPLRGHQPIVEASLNLTSSGTREARAFTPFVIARVTRVPYLHIYQNTLGSIGADIGQGTLTGAAALSYTLTHYTGTDRLWTGNGSVWYRPPGRRMDLRLTARLDRGRNGVGTEDYRRPGLGADVGYRPGGGLELRATWEYLRRRDRMRPASNYSENLFSFTAGRPFSLTHRRPAPSRNPAAAGGL